MSVADRVARTACATLSGIVLAWIAIALMPGASRAQSRGTLIGLVVEPSTGLPIPNVDVRVLGTTRVVRSDSVGAFRFAFDPGSYLLRATRIGFGPRSVRVDMCRGISSIGE